MNHVGKIISKEYILKNRCTKYKFINFNKMTNEEKIKKAEQLIKEVLINEEENNNVNESSLKELSDDVLVHLVNHWYLLREKEVFISDKGIEIDEHLNVEETILS